MNVMFTRHGLRAGVRQVNPHRFRHTFATWAIRVNARELDVQYLLGHSTSNLVGTAPVARRMTVSAASAGRSAGRGETWSFETLHS